MPARPGNAPIAVIGIGCRFPGGIGDPSAFWGALDEGRDAIRAVPADRFDLAHFYDERPATPGRVMTRWGGFLDDLDRFDAGFFGISPLEAERLDPAQRLVLECGWEALEDAGIDVTRLERSATGVYVGQWLSDFEARLFADPEQVDFYMTTGSGRYCTSGRLSFLLGLNGPSLTVDTACSSSLVAVHLAVRSLRSGESRLAIAGGVNVILQPHISVAYSQSRMMAPDGRCKFGDTAGDGYVRSEGAGLVVLKPLDDALADGDRIYAVIHGSAVNNDGRGSGSMGTPSRAGQEALLRSAFEDAGTDPRAVGYVEAHGTGTRAGDPVELGALGAVLGGGDGARARVGSVKTNFGHTEGAAGIAGLIKVALALHQGRIPASLHCKTPTPAVDWATMPIEMAREASDWRGPDRVGGVSAFGIAGTNAHVVLGAAPDAATVPRVTDGIPARPALLLLSARCPQALRELARRHAERMLGIDRAALDSVCWNVATRRAPLAHRAAFVADDASAMAARLQAFAAGEPADAVGTVHTAPAQGPVFVMPGQGGQWIGMARELMAREPAFHAALQACDAAARPWLGGSLVEQFVLDADSPGFHLDRIEWIQPTLLAVGIAYARWLGSIGIEPSAVTGHSMGEVGAAHLAGVLDLDQAMRIICRRSALMGRTSGRGGMAMVDLSMADAELRIAGRETQLAVAVSNAPRSCVVSGDPQALQTLLAELEADGVFCRLVKVDVASHSPQMDSPAAQLVDELHDLVPHPARVPLYSTVLARRAEATELDAGYWGRNLRQPVRFGAVTEQLVNGGADTFVELGPHPVLTTAIAQTAQALGREVTALACGRREDGEQRSALAVVAQLWAAGHAIDAARVMPATGWIDLPTYPWQRERHWVRQAAPLDVNRRGAPKAEPLGEEREQWLHALRWVPVEPPPRAEGAAPGAWLVVADDAGAGEALANALRAAGAEAAAITAQQLDNGVVPPGWANPRGLVRWLADGEHAPFAPVAALQAARASQLGPGVRLWVVTTGAQAVDGQAHGHVEVRAGAAWGAARVLAEEHPDRWGGLVDLDPRDALGTQCNCMVRELLGKRDETQLAWRQGQRHALRLQALQDPTPEPVAWRPDASYLLTGGLGELGLHVAQGMVRAGARRLVLLGRHGLPQRREWNAAGHDERTTRRIAAVRALEAAGATVHLLVADVADAAQVERALQAFADEAWPPIRGVVHAAGVNEDRLALDCTDSQFERVLAPKLEGALHLDRLLPDLDQYIVFSSMCAFMGIPGTAAYAAANAGLDALVAARRSAGRSALSLQWGPWDSAGLLGGEAGARATEQFARAGIRRFGTDDGTRLFLALSGRRESAISVLPIDWAVFCAATTGRRSGLFDDRPEWQRAKAPQEAALADQLAGASPLERSKALERVIREALGQTLKIAPARIESKKLFGAMGLSSLLSMELRNRLEAALSRPLSATLAWNYPTVESLVAFLAGLLAPAPAAPPTPATVSTTPAPANLGVVADLTDEQAAQLLRRRR